MVKLLNEDSLENETNARARFLVTKSAIYLNKEEDQLLDDDHLVLTKKEIKELIGTSKSKSNFAYLDISDRLTGEGQFFIITEEEALKIGDDFILLFNGVWQIKGVTYTYNPETRILTTLFSEDPKAGESLVIVYIN